MLRPVGQSLSTHLDSLDTRREEREDFHLGGNRRRALSEPPGIGRRKAQRKEGPEAGTSVSACPHHGVSPHADCGDPLCQVNVDAGDPRRGLQSGRDVRYTALAHHAANLEVCLKFILVVVCSTT